MPFVQVNYKRMHYADFAPSGTPKFTIVAVHGLGSSQNYYAAMAASLTSSGVRVLAIDASGAARTKYGFIEQSVHSLATDIIEFMDALQLPQAWIMGHSMCGLTVPHLAGTWPARVEGVILLGPVHSALVSAATFEQRIAAVEKHGMQAMADTVPSAAVGTRATPLAKAFIRELLLGQEAAGYISNCRVIVSGGRDGVDYSKVAAPLVVIAGEQDKSAPLAGCERIVGEATSADKELVVLKEIGHWMAVEAPEECAGEVIKFLGKRV